MCIGAVAPPVSCILVAGDISILVGQGSEFGSIQAALGRVLLNQPLLSWADEGERHPSEAAHWIPGNARAWPFGGKCVIVSINLDTALHLVRQ